MQLNQKKINSDEDDFFKSIANFFRAEKLTFHAALSGEGLFCFTVYPNFFLTEKTSPSAFKSEASRVSQLPFVKELLDFLLVDPSEKNFHFKLPAYSTAIPLPSLFFCELELKKYWNEKSQCYQFTSRRVESQLNQAQSGKKQVYSLPARHTSIKTPIDLVFEKILKLSTIDDCFFSPGLIQILKVFNEWCDVVKIAIDEFDFNYLSRIEYSVLQRLLTQYIGHEQMSTTFRGAVKRFEDGEVELFSYLQADAESIDIPILPRIDHTKVKKFTKKLTNVASLYPAFLTKSRIDGDLPWYHDSEEHVLAVSNRMFISAFYQLTMFAFDKIEHNLNRETLTQEQRCKIYLNRANECGLRSALTALEWSTPSVGQPVAVIVSENSDFPCVTFEPAVINPEIETLTTSEAKKASLTTAGLVTLKELLDSNDETDPSNWTIKNRVWMPHLRRTLLQNILVMIDDHPQIFSSPELFQNGTVTISNKTLDETLKENKELATFAPLFSVTKNLKLRIKGELFQKPYALPSNDFRLIFEGSAPWPAKWNKVRRSDATDTALLAYPVFEKSSSFNIQIRVKFQARNESMLAKSIEKVSNSLQRVSQNSRDNLANQILTTLENNIEGVTQELVFSPVPYFLVNEKEYSEAEWGAAKKVGTYRVLADGIKIPAEDFDRYLDLFILRKKVLSKFQNLTLSQLWKVNDKLGFGDISQKLSNEEYLSMLDIRVSPALEPLQNALPAQIADAVLVDSKVVTLRPYQRFGIGWIYLRLCLGLGACLADEMGLGKTLQAICVIQLRLSRTARQNPVLCVVPKSLVTNWLREFEKFAPTTKVKVFTPNQKNLTLDTEVLIITYPQLRAARELLQSADWDLVVLDEAHAIKNTDTQISAAVRELKTSGRLALTGTPLENHAGELWNLMDWLNSGWLGSSRDFQEYIRFARASDAKRKLLSPIFSVIEPVLLRRRKNDPKIELNLPEKVIENIEYELTDEQKQLYAAILETIITFEESDISAFARSAMYMKAILHLKQICNHPDCFLSASDDDDNIANFADDSRLRKLIQKRIETRKKLLNKTSNEQFVSQSAKMQLLLDLLLKMKESDGGILIFTQFRASARMIQQMLTDLSDVSEWVDCDIIDGSLSTDERMTRVDNFQRRSKIQDQTPPVLICTPKAGGVGLNLTGATRVIHFDRWWNPAVEDQATDRAHRIGQSKTVFVYTLTASGTIEEGIERMLHEKRNLAQDLVDMASGDQLQSNIKSQSGFLALVDPYETYLRWSWQS